MMLILLCSKEIGFMAKKKGLKKKVTAKRKLSSKTKAVPAKKTVAKRKVAIEEKIKTKISADHIQCDLIDDLIERIVNTIDLDEKVRWSWDLMSECRALENSPAINKHMVKCKSCENFLRARKSLAELIIKGARV